VAQYPVITAGTRLTADLLDSMLVDVTVKATTENRISTTTLAADSELQGVSLSIGRWEVVVTGGWQSSTAATVAKTQWAFTGTWNNPLRMCDGPTSTNTTIGSGAYSRQWSGYLTNGNTTYGLASSSAFTHFREESALIVVTVAGLMSFNWAQNASSANNTGLVSGSKIIARKIGD
jgi:hypothetical protein